MDLSENKFGNSGVQKLCALLQHQSCNLQILRLSDCSITEEGYSALSEALKSSHLIELDLRGNDPGASGVKLLTDLLQDQKLKTLRLLKSSAAQEACNWLNSVVGKNSLLLKELDLSRKETGDSGVEKLSVLMKDPHCKFQKIQLSECNLTERSCWALHTVLSSESSKLTEVDLSSNPLEDSGVKKLCAGLKSPNCKLEKLRLLKSPAAQEGRDLLYRVLGVNPLLQRELNVSEKISGDSQVKQLSALREDSHCRPEILKVNNSRMTNEGCAALTSARGFKTPSHLRELELSGNKLGGSGMKELCGVLKNQQFNLLKLGLCKCSITEDDCTAVVSALGLNPSHLKELDLSDNTIGDTGVKQLSDLLQNSHCTLEKLKILSPEAEKACDDLTKALGTNLLQTELDLSGKISGDSGVKQLSVLLKDPQCRPETLRLNKSSITHRGCTDLISALTSNPSHLTELDLSENTRGNSAMDKISTLLKNSSCKLQKLVVLKSPDAQKASDHLTEVLGINPILQTDLNLSGKIDGDSGVEQLSVLLKDPHCRPETLQLSECNVTEKGCSALLTALRSEHSTLKELNLSKNRIQDSGVKLLSEELKNKLCKLETLRLMDNNIREEGYSALSEALKSSHLIELDLRGNDPGASGVKLLTDLLQDPDCKLNTLRLYKGDSMTDDDCSHVISALVLNPSHLRELNLNRNKPGESGLRDLCDFLKNPKCTLQTLKLWKSVKGKSCTDLVSALCTNPSHIRELDLRECELGDSGVEKLCDLLKKHECKLEKL
ncbi:hypothetical protein QTP86_003127, partial [Hemibagrus guttatus]